MSALTSVCHLASQVSGLSKNLNVAIFLDTINVVNVKLYWSSGEIKIKEVQLGSHSWVVCLATELFLNSYFSTLSL